MQFRSILPIFAILATLIFCCALPGHSEPAANPTLQQQFDELREKVTDLQEVIGDPEGTVKTTQSDVSKLKRLTWGGYLQGRYQHNLGGGAIDDFFLRRARLGITVRPSGNVMAKVSFDGAKGFELKDAFLVWLPQGPERGPSLAFGQQNWCFGREVPVSSSVREAPERALFARTLFPGERDLGFKVTSEAGHPLVLELGVFNGAGLNKRDADDGKDIVGRLGWTANQRLDVGVSGYFGSVQALGSYGGGYGHSLRTYVKNRYGADLTWLAANGITVKAEGVYARELGRNPYGWLAQIAANLGESLVLVVRCDEFESDGLLEDGRVRALNIGLIQHLSPNLRVKLFWENQRESNGSIKNDRIVAEILTTF